MVSCLRPSGCKDPDIRIRKIHGSNKVPYYLGSSGLAVSLNLPEASVLYTYRQYKVKLDGTPNKQSHSSEIYMQWFY